MAAKSHDHVWHPISFALGATTFNFKAKDRPGPAKPRGYVQPKPNETVLWACGHSWSEYDAKTRTTKRHYCTAVITHPDVFRLRTKGEWKDEWDQLPANNPPEKPQTPPRRRETAREKLERVRRERTHDAVV